MPDYKALYEQLFDAVTDAIIKLRQAQIDAVDTYIAETKKEQRQKASEKIKADFTIKTKET